MVIFFLLAAAWVSPGRIALQSAKQGCYRRYGHKHKMMSYIIQTLSKTCNKAKKPSAYSRKAEAKKQDLVYKTRALVKSRRKAPTPERENIQVDTNVQEEGFGEIPKESTYASAGSAHMWSVGTVKRWLQRNVGSFS